MPSFPLRPVVLLVLFAAIACKPGAVVVDAPAEVEGDPSPPAAADLPPAAASGDLRRAAEGRILAQLTPALAGLIREQPWFEDVTAAEYRLIETLRDMERAAQRHGVEARFMDSLRLAAGQAWIADGLDDDEAKALTALYRAYQSSLADRHLPDIGEQLSSSIRGNYFRTVQLPESGEVTIVLAADNERLANAALSLAMENLPKVEALIGPFPYPYVYIQVTSLGDSGVLGLNRNEFVFIGENAVETNTVAHELAHAALYGIFPIWFEEGLAYYTGAWAADEIRQQEQQALRTIAATRRPRQLDLRAKFDHSDAGYFSTISQGFLFFQGLVDIQGLDGLGQVVRSLRSKTFANDNELLRQMVANSAPDKQQAVQEYLCRAVIGLRSGCD